MPRKLSESGAGIGDVVAVIGDRSANLVAAVIGTFEQGCVLLLIDKTDGSYVEVGEKRLRSLNST